VEYHIDMMRTVVASLMVAVLAAQTVFGCCWHHAHWHLHGDRSLARAAPPVKCCQHHQHESESQPPQEPCHNHDQCQGLSTFLLPQKVQIDASQCVASLDLPVIIPDQANGQVGSMFSWEVVGCSHTIEPPVRLHLLHQTLLI
jgi:hypothetical protein